jgi:hypothetical protein
VLFFTLSVISALTWGAGRINSADSTPKQPVEETSATPRAA